MPPVTRCLHSLAILLGFAGCERQVPIQPEVITGRTLEQSIPECRALVEDSGALYTAVTTHPLVTKASRDTGIPIFVESAETVWSSLDIIAMYPEAEWAGRCRDRWTTNRRETENTIQILTGTAVNLRVVGDSIFNPGGPTGVPLPTGR